MPPSREGSARVPGSPGPVRPSQQGGAQFEPDSYEDGLPGRSDPGRRTGRDGLVWSLDAALMDTVARLQLDMEEMRAGSRGHRTPPPGSWTSQGHWQQMTFTSTNVPRFAGVTSWEQYRQVVDAIVLSNGWDDATEGDALNIALLVPELRRATRVVLVGTLTAH